MTVLGRIITYNYFIKAQLMLGFLFFHTSCEQQNKMSLLTGNTMGTTYSIKIIQSNDRMNIESIKKGVDSVLIQINNDIPFIEHGAHGYKGDSNKNKRKTRKPEKKKTFFNQVTFHCF